MYLASNSASENLHRKSKVGMEEIAKNVKLMSSISPCIVLLSMANVFLKMFSGYSIIEYFQKCLLSINPKDNFMAPPLFCGVHLT